MKYEYKQKIKEEISFYDHSFKAHVLHFPTYYVAMHIKYLRYTAYYEKKSGIFSHFLYVFYYCMTRHYFYKTRLAIGPNSCDWGIKIWHCGDIIINNAAKVGKNLTIYPGCIIGQKHSIDEVPVIGDNCYMGAGSKVFGKVRIGNNVTIAPNAIVTCDIPDNCIVAGIPAKIIKFK